MSSCIGLRINERYDSLNICLIAVFTFDCVLDEPKQLNYHIHSYKSLLHTAVKWCVAVD